MSRCRSALLQPSSPSARFRVPFGVLLSMAMLVALPAAAAPMSGEAALSLLPGVYELQEWHTPDGVLKPPQIYGRFFLIDGTIATVLRNEAQPDKRSTSVTVGYYELDRSHFAYTYTNASSFTETASEVSASHKAPWEGLRSFKLELIPEGVRLRSEGGQEFVFTRAGMTYSEKAGTPLRVYRRISKR
jgi:hypothetical protein